MLITYAQSSFNTHVKLSSGARCLNFGLSLHLLSFFVCEKLRLWQDCAVLSEHSILVDVIST